MPGMRSRRKKSWLAGWIAGLLLVTQFAMAAQACMLAQGGVAGASQQKMAAPSCDGAPTDIAACLARCLGQDQTTASLDPHFQAVPASAAIVSAAFALPAMLSALAPPTAARLPTGPPLQILYCSYQI